MVLYVPGYIAAIKPGCVAHLYVLNIAKQAAGSKL